MAENREESDEPQNIEADFVQLAGVWADWVRVSYSEHGFTIDFVRRDPVDPNQGILVARVAMSSLLASQLIESLESIWQTYAERSMPKEVRDAGETEDHDQGGPEG